MSQSSNNFRFSAAVAEFAMLLRDSEFKGSASIEHVLKQAKASTGQDPFGYRAEFLMDQNIDYLSNMIIL